MKKYLLSAWMLLICATMFAFAPTAILQLELSSDAGYKDVITIVEDASYSTGLDQSADAQKNISVTNPAQNVFVYAMVDFYSGGKAGMLATNDLDGVFLGVKTNTAETDYTFTFKVATLVGVEYYLIDLYEAVATPIALNATYDFEAAAGAEINNRFIIKATSDIPYVATLTTNEYGYASFSWDVDLQAAESDLKIYKGALEGVEVLNMTEVDYVKAGEGVIVKGAANTDYHFIAGTASADFDGNDLKASATWTTDLENVYCLNGNELRHYVGTDPVPAHKAYIQLPELSPNSAPRHISLRFGQATAIDNVEAGAQAEKFIENGQVLIRRGNEVYNLQGQIVK